MCFSLSAGQKFSGTRALAEQGKSIHMISISISTGLDGSLGIDCGDLSRMAMVKRMGRYCPVDFTRVSTTPNSEIGGSSSIFGAIVRYSTTVYGWR